METYGLKTCAVGKPAHNRGNSAVDGGRYTGMGGVAEGGGGRTQAEACGYNGAERTPRRNVPTIRREKCSLGAWVTPGCFRGESPRNNDGRPFGETARYPETTPGIVPYNSEVWTEKSERRVGARGLQQRGIQIADRVGT